MIWDFNPVAFSLFGLDVRWYGLVYALGFLLAYFWATNIHQQIVDRPLKKDDYQNVIFYTFVFGVIGGRIGEFVFYNPSLFFSNPLEILKIWHGGMSIHGGVLGAVFYLWYASRRYKSSFFSLSDPLVLPLSVVLIFGRFTNFINGELVGKPTGTDWGVVFPHVDSLLRHPTQLYESGYSLLLSVLLAFFLFRGEAQKPSFLTASFLVLYGVFRFVVEFWKPIGWEFLSLNTGQWLCLLMVILGSFVFWTYWKQKKDEPDLY